MLQIPYNHIPFHRRTSSKGLGLVEKAFHKGLTLRQGSFQTLMSECLFIGHLKRM